MQVNGGFVVSSFSITLSCAPKFEYRWTFIRKRFSDSNLQTEVIFWLPRLELKVLVVDTALIIRTLGLIVTTNNVNALIFLLCALAILTYGGRRLWRL